MNIESMKQYEHCLHPRTIDKIIQYFDIMNGSVSSLSDSKDELEYSITSVQIDHYSYKEQEQFMIVKTIEEMYDNQDNFYVIQTLRIYKE